MALKDNVHRPNSLRTPAANPAIHAIDRFVILRVLHFYFCFQFLLIHAAGSSVAPHSYSHLFRELDFRCICQRQIQNPEEDDEEVSVGVVTELADKPGTTNGK